MASFRESLKEEKECAVALSYLPKKLEPFLPAIQVRNGFGKNGDYFPLPRSQKKLYSDQKGKMVRGKNPCPLQCLLLADMGRMKRSLHKEKKVKSISTDDIACETRR